MDWIEQIRLIGEVALAALLGGLIGFEREIADRPAGLRTHMLVSSAAALFVGLTDSFLEVYTGLGYAEFMSIDPIRVTQAIVTGVAFLGAGTIFRGGRENYIQGLTTAASILLVSGIGMAVALNEFILAGGVTLLALMVLRGLWIIEKRIGKNRQP